MMQSVNFRVIAWLLVGLCVVSAWASAQADVGVERVQGVLTAQGVAQDYAVVFANPKFAMRSAMINLPVYADVFLAGELELVDGRLAVPRIETARGTHLWRAVRQIEERQDLIDALIDLASQPECDLVYLEELINPNPENPQVIRSLGMYRQAYRWLRAEAMRSAANEDLDRFAECIAGIIGLCAQLVHRPDDSMHEGMPHSLTSAALFGSLLPRPERVPSEFQLAIRTLEGDRAMIVGSALDRLDPIDPVQMRRSWVASSLEAIADADETVAIAQLVMEFDQAWIAREEAALERAYQALLDEPAGVAQERLLLRASVDTVKLDWHWSRELVSLRERLERQGR